MKKISLIAALFIGLLLLQNCKKDTVTANTYSTQLFFASINDTSWKPTSLTANMNYDVNTKIKAFSCIAATTSQQVAFSVRLKNALNSAGFSLNTYNVDTTTNVNMSYSALQKTATGGTELAPVGSVTPGSGYVIISAIDSVNKVITGTFAFTTVKNNYDSSGNVVSVSVSRVSSGAFNKMPYTFTNVTN